MFELFISNEGVLLGIVCWETIGVENIQSIRDFAQPYAPFYTPLDFFFNRNVQLGLPDPQIYLLVINY